MLRFPIDIPASDLVVGDRIRRTLNKVWRSYDLTVEVISIDLETKMVTVEALSVEFQTPRLLAFGPDEKVTVIR